MCKFSHKETCTYEDQFLSWDDTVFSAKVLLKKLPLDSNQLCIFHSKNLQWKRETNFHGYLLAFINLCEKDSRIESIDILNITLVGNINKSIDLSNRSFTKPLQIKFCIFEDFLDFRNSIFQNLVDFHKSIFNASAHFNKSKFYNRTGINNCTFNKPVYFNDSEFIAEYRDSYLSFTESIFNEQANFSDTKYLGKYSDVNFQLVQFKHNIYFTASLFERHVIFNGSTFEEGNADFRSVVFENKVLFNERVQNGKKNIVSFDNVDFSNAQFKNIVEFQGTIFNKNSSFNNTVLNQSLFRNITVNSELSFIESVFGMGDFDNISLHADGRISFRGSSSNKIFTRQTNFNIKEHKINGYILFENTKVSWISKTQIELLRLLEKNGKLFFRDCEFETNVTIISYFLKGTTGNFLLFKKIFQNLSDWIELFTNGVQTSLEVDSSQKRSNEIRIKVVWLRDEDLDLFKTLSKYFFDCLNEEKDEKLTEILSEITSNDFLRSFATEENNHFPSLSLNLQRLLNDTITYFKFNIYNNKTELSIKSNLLLENNNTNLEEIYLLQIKNRIKSFQEHFGIHSNFTIEFIMGDKNSITNSQMGAVGSKAISSGHSFQQINNSFPENLDFDGIRTQLKILREHLAAQAKTPEEYQSIGEVAKAEIAAQKNDGEQVIKHLKAAGNWVVDIAKNIGIDLVVELMKNLI